MHALNLDSQQKPRRLTATDMDVGVSQFQSAEKELLSASAGQDRAIAGTIVRFLDRTVPLEGASHGDVESYGVDIPLRFASLFAVLTDGRKVRLRDARYFAGWSGWTGKRSFLLRRGRKYIEIRTDPARPLDGGSPGYVCDLVIESTTTSEWLSLRSFAATHTRAADSGTPVSGGKFIAPDGSLLFTPA